MVFLHPFPGRITLAHRFDSSKILGSFSRCDLDEFCAVVILVNVANEKVVENSGRHSPMILAYKENDILWCRRIKHFSRSAIRSAFYEHKFENGSDTILSVIDCSKTVYTRSTKWASTGGPVQNRKPQSISVIMKNYFTQFVVERTTSSS